uniref:RING-type domain-containing protein n=1 Tax=Chlamydomonas leiostraca TaxID=1034604 RepID=A0A7S0WQJ6_9CHLO|mmetsp:Transcript_23414/g.59934  ORF Transcript_23414/g.59934 Transcript_23414/m.59934 type:complete len:1064 (+) Transcript_23414:166-3357(+)|eukprot:CAMPEP_0202872968 /NCGR_PEP_ID=MMETSP1391-20130828/22351_1 /ASSEMBLY_ACC=CAM_ASM_000867 /TAXON_ID=1034604 /ORGANISM="Chlamydomonas leiostraca, Strain SAG 11-49" /LENGTH=1063 /DNA_ID=CAMNT_0049554119 /DNA_START=135 /DNA_END=3326 /DNA_ORIENTATION=+
MGAFKALLGLGLGYVGIKYGFKAVGAVVAGVGAVFNLGYEGVRQLATAGWMLAVPPNAHAYLGPPTLLHQLWAGIGATVRLLSPASASGWLMGLVVAPALLVGVISAASLLHRIKALQPLMGGAWLAARFTATAALAAATIDDAVRARWLAGYTLTGLLQLYTGLGLGVVAARMVTQPLDPARRKRAQRAALRAAGIGLQLQGAATLLTAARSPAVEQARATKGCQALGTLLAISGLRALGIAFGIDPAALAAQGAVAAANKVGTCLKYAATKWGKPAVRWLGRAIDRCLTLLDRWANTLDWFLRTKVWRPSVSASKKAWAAWVKWVWHPCVKAAQAAWQVICRASKAVYARVLLPFGRMWVRSVKKVWAAACAVWSATIEAGKWVWLVLTAVVKRIWSAATAAARWGWRVACSIAGWVRRWVLKPTVAGARKTWGVVAALARRTWAAVCSTARAAWGAACRVARWLWQHTAVPLWRRALLPALIVAGRACKALWQLFTAALRKAQQGAVVTWKVALKPALAAAATTVATLAWPSITAVCCVRFAQEALRTGRVVPYGLAAWSVAGVMLSTAGKRMKAAGLLGRAGEVAGWQLEAMGCRLYLWSDLGVVEVTIKLVQWLWPHIARAARAARSVAAFVASSIGNVLGAVLATTWQLVKAAWQLSVRAALKPLAKGLKGLVAAVWNRPEAGLLLSAATLGVLWWAQRSGLGAAVAAAVHVAGAWAWSAPFVAAAKVAAVAGSPPVLATLRFLGAAASGSRTAAMWVAAGAANAARKAAEGAAPAELFAQHELAQAVYIIQLGQALSLRYFLLPRMQATILTHAQQVHTLVTSREALTARGAREVLVRGNAKQVLVATTSFFARSAFKGMILPTLTGSVSLLLLGQRAKWLAVFLCSCTPAMAVGCLLTVWAEGFVRLDLPAPPASSPSNDQGSGSSSRGTDEETALLAAIKASGPPAKVYFEPTCVICYDDFPEGAINQCACEHSQAKAPQSGTSSQDAAGKDSGDDQSQQPLVLHCGHVFHRGCVVSWARAPSHYGGTKVPRCPVCREPMIVGAGRTATSMLLF